MFGGAVGEPDATRAEVLDRVSQHLQFDRGELGLQVEIPDPVGSESWTAPIIVRKFASSALSLPRARTRWRYLKAEHRRAIREAIATQPEELDWRRLVIHSSASETGNALLLHQDQQRRWPSLEKSAYHFVIGNGTFSSDGEIEVGARWIEQQPGAAMQLPELNYHSLSVCLIGTFREKGPSNAQSRALDELLAYLRAQLGPIELAPHHGVESTAQSCPGPALTEALIQQLGERSS